MFRKKTTAMHQFVHVKYSRGSPENAKDLSHSLPYWEPTFSSPASFILATSMHFDQNQILFKLRMPISRKIAFDMDSRRGSSLRYAYESK